MSCGTATGNEVYDVWKAQVLEDPFTWGVLDAYAILEDDKSSSYTFSPEHQTLGDLLANGFVAVTTKHGSVRDLIDTHVVVDFPQQCLYLRCRPLIFPSLPKGTVVRSLVFVKHHSRDPSLGMLLMRTANASFPIHMKKRGDLTFTESGSTDDVGPDSVLTLFRMTFNGPADTFLEVIMDQYRKDKLPEYVHLQF